MVAAGPAIKDQVRALEPWPKTYTFWHRQDGPAVRLILDRVAVVERPAEPGVPPGTVVEAQGDRLVLAAGAGALRLSSIQPAGKRALAADEFLRGYRVQPGERFGPE